MEYELNSCWKKRGYFIRIKDGNNKEIYDLAHQVQRTEKTIIVNGDEFKSEIANDVTKTSVWAQIQHDFTKKKVSSQELFVILNQVLNHRSLLARVRGRVRIHSVYEFLPTQKLNKSSGNILIFIK